MATTKNKKTNPEPTKLSSLLDALEISRYKLISEMKSKTYITVNKLFYNNYAELRGQTIQDICLACTNILKKTSKIIVSPNDVIYNDFNEPLGTWNNENIFFNNPDFKAEYIDIISRGNENFAITKLSFILYKKQIFEQDLVKLSENKYAVPITRFSAEKYIKPSSPKKSNMLVSTITKLCDMLDITANDIVWNPNSKNGMW